MEQSGNREASLMHSLPPSRVTETRAAIKKVPARLVCDRCRKVKKGCDGFPNQTCTLCEHAGKPCIFTKQEKDKPATKAQVDVLHQRIASLDDDNAVLVHKVAWLEDFIRKLNLASSSQRDGMLLSHMSASSFLDTQPAEAVVNNLEFTEMSVFARSREVHLNRLKGGVKSSHFYGASNVFPPSPMAVPAPNMPLSDTLLQTIDISWPTLAPWSEVCQKYMALFFDSQYQYHMSLYREWFLRDYDRMLSDVVEGDLDSGAMPYYSDLLLYAICSLGALVSREASSLEMSELFFSHAQQLLFESALDCPNITTLQSLILLGHRQIGCGKLSKGWLLSGMAFRLAHEMGLHLDPENWESSTEEWRDMEISRRTFWAAFVADTQLSLYFGRPPALYPSQSDVRKTVRMKYPEEWKRLLNTYIKDSISQSAYEDGLTLVTAFVQQVELSKITHRMIAEIFENRNTDQDKTDASVAIACIDSCLKKWWTELPKEWKCATGKEHPLILNILMMYHSALIILHRPARAFLQKESTDCGTLSGSQSVQTCYNSLQAITTLLEQHPQDKFGELPFTFVHVLASTASVIVLKRFIEGLAWDHKAITKPLDVVRGAFDQLSKVWPCAGQVMAVVDTTVASSMQSDSQQIQEDWHMDLDQMGQVSEQQPFFWS